MLCYDVLNVIMARVFHWLIFCTLLYVIMNCLLALLIHSLVCTRTQTLLTLTRSLFQVFVYFSILKMLFHLRSIGTIILNNKVHLTRGGNYKTKTKRKKYCMFNIASYSPYANNTKEYYRKNRIFFIIAAILGKSSKNSCAFNMHIVRMPLKVTLCCDPVRLFGSCAMLLDVVRCVQLEF